MATVNIAEPDINAVSSLAAQLEPDLLKQYGPLITGDALTRALGYPTGRAFQQAVIRDLVDVPIFSIPRRRGKFALTKDVANWLAAQRIAGRASLELERSAS